MLQRLAVAMIVMLAVVGLAACARPTLFAAPPNAATGSALVAITSEVEAESKPIGVDPALWRRLVAELDRQLLARQTSDSSTQLTDQRFTVGDFTIAGRTGEFVTASWTYQNPGDYDQNGEVNAADLAYLARYFGHKQGDSDWAAAQLADGNHNGLVEISDISVIGQNYHNAVDGYTLLMSWGDADGNGDVNIGDVPAYSHLDYAQPPSGYTSYWPDGTQTSCFLLGQFFDEQYPIPVHQPQPPSPTDPLLLLHFYQLSQAQSPPGGGPRKFNVTQRVHFYDPATLYEVSVSGFWSSVCAHSVTATGHCELGRAGNAALIPAGDLP